MQPESYFEEETLDDLLIELFPVLLKQQERFVASRGKFSEIFGAMLVLRNPRARLSRSESKGKLFSAIGELLWYLSKNNDLAFIEYYIPKQRDESEDGLSVRSGYGQRLHNHQGQDQIKNVIDLLKRKPSSRRAVIQLFDASDLSEDFTSIPCTCTLQFLIRNDQLNLLVNMRSNDAFLGLPHDVFAFTMLQEIIARSIGVEVGIYKHCAGSLHLYEDDFEAAEKYINEGWQVHSEMPPMPVTNPWDALGTIAFIESQIRTTESVELKQFGLDDYWNDICRLLMVYRLSKGPKSFRHEKAPQISEIKAKMTSKVYNIFIDSRLGL